MHQAISRDGGLGVPSRAILDAARNPVRVIEQAARNSQYVRDAIVVTNSSGARHI